METPVTALLRRLHILPHPDAGAATRQLADDTCAAIEQSRRLRAALADAGRRHPPSVASALRGARDHGEEDR